MGVYSFFIIILSIASVVELVVYNKRKDVISFFYVLIAISFVAIGGFTEGNGLDWYAYQSISQEKISINDIWNHSQYEPLFLLLYDSFPTFHVFLFVFVCLNFILLSKTIISNSPYVIISIFIYVCVYYFLGIMGQLRQALAISLIVFSWPYIKSKKIIFFVLLASLFHYSAIICLLYYCVPNRLFKKHVYLCVLLFICFTFEYFQSLLLTALENFSYGKVLLYVNIEDGGISTVFILYKLFVFFLFLYRIDRCVTNLPKYKIANIYFLSIILYLILSFSSSIGGRIILYFTMFEILIIPFIINSYSRMIKRLLISILFIMINVYQYFSFLYSFSDTFIPYKFLFL